MPIAPSSSRPIAPAAGLHSAGIQPAASTSTPGASHMAAGAARAVAREAQPSTAPPEEGFADHLKAAIALNRTRRDVYDRLSGGDSRSLSNLLIALETLSLPVAHALDSWAKGFQKRGIPAIKQDFVSMQNVPSPFAPPRWKGVASDQEASTIEGWLDEYRQVISAGIDDNDFQGVAQASYDLLTRLESTESETRTHWAMTKHLVESLGFAAMNAIDYAEQSGGETNRLSRNFLRYQSLGLRGSIGVDREAQTLHQRGIGILVNDIPPIPFAARWEARLPNQA